MDEKKKPLGLYIHIPFCKRKCAYCDFYSLPLGEEAMDEYCRVLIPRLRAAGERAEKHIVDTVFFGGGTPSLLAPRRLNALLAAVADAFTLAPDAEITLEANPDRARDAAALRALRRGGFNRISLGMQSADEGELRVLGRLHSSGETAEAVSAARAAGFENLSLDLMYGLPEQDMARWEGSLDAALSLAPEHLSCYALKLEPGTPLHAAQDTLRLPDGDAQAELYLRACEKLSSVGYEHYEISNFARPGFASRHNLKYWTLGEYLGFGPGAHSDFGGRRFSAPRDLRLYLADERARGEDERISPRERRRERIMLFLRTARGIPAEEAAGAEGFLRRCAENGLARERGGRWSLTDEGFFVSNAVILGVLEALGL